jgi:hypothetical protein
MFAIKRLNTAILAKENFFKTIKSKEDHLEMTIPLKK